MAATDILQSLGLNALEAEVYTFLLQQPEPVTAYKVGKALGKATANVYKAMNSLALQGAVMVTQGEPRLCRAAAVEEFLGQLERRFAEHKAQAQTALQVLRPAPSQEAIYRLETVPAVLERATAMLARAKQTVVLDAFPASLAAVAAEAKEAAARGVRVLVLTYAPAELAGCEVVVASRGPQALAFWQSEQLNLVVDGQEALLTWLSGDLQRVFQALWSDSLYLACLLHAGLGMERTFHAVEALRGQMALPAEIEAILDRQGHFYNSRLPGQEQLFQRIRGLAPGEKSS